jgi:hypothetical protein
MTDTLKQELQENLKISEEGLKALEIAYAEIIKHCQAVNMVASLDHTFWAVAGQQEAPISLREMLQSIHFTKTIIEDLKIQINNLNMTV